MSKKLFPLVGFFLLSILGMLLLGCFPGQEKKPSFSLLGRFRLKTSVIAVESLVQGLDVPWEILRVQNSIWYTLQSGEVWRLDLNSGSRKRLLEIPDVFRYRTLGLLGMAVDRADGPNNVCLVYNSKSDAGHIVTKLLRYTYEGDTLVHPRTLLEWPGNTGHNGARLLFGSKGEIFISAGDRAEGELAQNLSSLNGKILRLNVDGSIPADNPFENSYVWSYGHRNAQGLCYGAHGLIYSSEHGDASDDEINLIEKGGNYGWPYVEGEVDREGERMLADSLGLVVTSPLSHWTPTIAPAAIAYYGNGPIEEFRNSLLMVALKGSALHVIHLNGDGREVLGEDIYFKNRFGRLRGVAVGEDGEVYISTSNRDWNPGKGFPKSGDDHIIRIYKTKAERGETLLAAAMVQADAVNSSAGYKSYCASCHKDQGEGLAGTFPPLKGNPILKNNGELLDVVLNGIKESRVIMGGKYEQPMPRFDFLNDEQIAEVLNYVKKEFGDGGVVSKEDVVNARRKEPF